MKFICTSHHAPDCTTTQCCWQLPRDPKGQWSGLPTAPWWDAVHTERHSTGQTMFFLPSWDASDARNWNSGTSTFPNQGIQEGNKYQRAKAEQSQAPAKTFQAFPKLTPIIPPIIHKALCIIGKEDINKNSMFYEKTYTHTHTHIYPHTFHMQSSLFFKNTYSLGAEEFDGRIHQFQHGTELQEILPQVPLISVCDYHTQSHMQENNPLQDRALIWKERKAQSHGWMVLSEPVSVPSSSSPFLIWDLGSLICTDVYEVSL